MKKNGKKYRRIQKEKERKRTLDFEWGISQKTCICQEVNDINTANLAIAHIVTHHPILTDDMENKKEYLKRLGNYIKAGGWNDRKFEKAALSAYEKIILESKDCGKERDISFYKYYILLDVIHILAYEWKPSDMEQIGKVQKEYYRDFGECADSCVVDRIVWFFKNTQKEIKHLLHDPDLLEEREYLRFINKNLIFKRQQPFGVLVTATMSAGKSTFINALAGKYICMSQVMACTSKIHCIVNKAFEDGYSSEYDYDLTLTAGKEELLNDNELNLSDKIVVSTKFEGGLSEQRMIVNDSPGVNYSGDLSHKQMTNQLIQSKNYNLLIYVMNATQLATNDESEHLDFVKKTVGEIPVLFVINKIDTLNMEEEDLESVVQRQIAMLKEKGFQNPIVCPVSSKAGYLAKKYKKSVLSKEEKRELYKYVDYFEQMNLKKYYAKAFQNIQIKNSEKEEEQLLKTSGLAYIEKIITTMIKGGN